MISIPIPGFADLQLVDLVCDYNGTLAHDGRLLPGVRDALTALAPDLRIHVVTADTHGGAARELQDLPLAIHVIAPADQASAQTDEDDALLPRGALRGEPQGALQGRGRLLVRSVEVLDQAGPDLEVDRRPAAQVAAAPRLVEQHACTRDVVLDDGEAAARLGHRDGRLGRRQVAEGGETVVGRRGHLGEVAPTAGAGAGARRAEP